MLLVVTVVLQVVTSLILLCVVVVSRLVLGLEGVRAGLLDAAGVGLGEAEAYVVRLLMVRVVFYLNRV